MAKETKSRRAHTGKTAGGHTRDVKVDRIGRVTVYRRGTTYSLYYRENGKTVRKKIDGNLAVAKATAAKVEASLASGQRSPIGFDRTTPSELVEKYVDYVSHTQQLALRTRDRYRAALDRLIEFCDEQDVKSIDTFDVARVEDFVRWLRGQTRTRNGAAKGKRQKYKTGGIRFILCTCRTAFRWATRRRMLPAYAENPFSEFPIDRIAVAPEDVEREIDKFLQQPFKTLCHILTPRAMRVTRSDDEISKQICASLRDGGGSVLPFDNAKLGAGSSIESPAIEMTVLAPEVSIRILGQSTTICVAPTNSSGCSR